MSAPASVSLPPRLRGRSRGDTPRPGPPASAPPLRAAAAAANGRWELSAAARPPRFKSASLRPSELEWGGPGGGLGRGGEGFGPPPRFAALPDPVPPGARLSPGGSTWSSRGSSLSEQRPDTPKPACSPRGAGQTGDASRRRRLGPGFRPRPWKPEGPEDSAWGGGEEAVGRWPVFDLPASPTALCPIVCGGQVLPMKLS